MLKRWAFVLGIVCIMSFPVAAAPELESDLLITEIQTASTSSTANEFIEITNRGNSAVSLTQIKLQYNETMLPSSGVWQRTISFSTGDTLAAGASLIVAGSSYSGAFPIVAPSKTVTLTLSENRGAVRLIAPATSITSEVVHDEVVWGTGVSNAPAPADSRSIKRFLSSSGWIQSGINSSNFFVSPLPSPGTQDFHSDENYPVIEISEILPEPDIGSDVSDEYIELFNPNPMTVNLTGYELKSGSDSYVFEGIALGAMQYLYLPSSYDPLMPMQLYTNLGISNDSGLISLTTPNNKSVNKVYYENGKEGLSYSLLPDGWQWTELPTPGYENELLITEEEASSSTDDGLKPCRSDQYRSPETNRCRLKNSSSGLQPCAANQYRNPETNRCRSLTTATSTLKPCAADQYRNPETNRCKKVEEQSSLKPCKEGQERNPETNRCRTVSAVSPSDAAAVLSTKDAIKNLPLIAAIGGGALLYALYEFRYDIRNTFRKARGYLGFRGSSGRDP